MKQKGPEETILNFEMGNVACVPRSVWPANRRSYVKNIFWRLIFQNS